MHLSAKHCGAWARIAQGCVCNERSSLMMKTSEKKKKEMTAVLDEKK